MSDNNWCAPDGQAFLPLTIVFALLTVGGLVWAVRRSAHGGLPTGLIIVLLSALPLQRLGVQIGTSQLAFGFVACVGAVFWLLIRGDLRLSPVRTLSVSLVFLLLVFATALNYSFSFSLLSLLFIFITYFSYAFMARQDEGMRLACFGLHQDIALIAAALGIAQYYIQFVFPAPTAYPIDVLIPDTFVLQNFCQFRAFDNSAEFKPTGGSLFLEPSFFSQVMTWAILIEIIIYRAQHLGRLGLYGIGLVLSAGGTGMLLAAIMVPFAFGAARRWDLLLAGALASVVFIPLAVIALDVDVLSLLRIDEFTEKNSSGYTRFVGPVRAFNEEIVPSGTFRLMLGHGPGSIDETVQNLPYYAFDASWIKAIVEYGFVGGLPLLALVVFSSFANGRSSVFGWTSVIQFLFLNGYLLGYVFHFTILPLLVWSSRNRSEVAESESN